MSRPCEGPLQDDTGAFYCPLNPYREDFDCAQCLEDFMHYQDLLTDIKRDREFEEEGNGTAWP